MLLEDDDPIMSEPSRESIEARFSLVLVDEGPSPACFFPSGSVLVTVPEAWAGDDPGA
jgi:hypothetical protein